jgi:hypothetical protein
MNKTMEDVLDANFTEMHWIYINKANFLAAMKEWETITNKERDEEIKKLKSELNDYRYKNSMGFQNDSELGY